MSPIGFIVRTGLKIIRFKIFAGASFALLFLTFATAFPINNTPPKYEAASMFGILFVVCFIFLIRFVIKDLTWFVKYLYGGSKYIYRDFNQL